MQCSPAGGAGRYTTPPCTKCETIHLYCIPDLLLHQNGYIASLARVKELEEQLQKLQSREDVVAHVNHGFPFQQHAGLTLYCVWLF